MKTSSLIVLLFLLGTSPAGKVGAPDSPCDQRWQLAGYLPGVVADRSVIADFRSGDREQWQPVERHGTIDLGYGPVDATFELCLDSSDRLSLVSVVFRRKDTDPRRLLRTLEARWSDFLNLGVADTVAGTGYFSAVAFDECAYHAYVNWAETRSGKIATVKVAIVSGRPPWINVKDGGKRFAIDHEMKDAMAWRYSYCAQRP